ncbi:glycoside hydrolase family 2 TIM barrel-domain containing protein [soil metagenome]
MDLSGRWHALEADEDLRRTWLDDDVDETTWEPIDVPGHWRSTPAFAQSDGPLLHRNRFAHERLDGDERAWLVLDGCFYQGDVWLDGAYVGDTEGYFFPHGFEVTEALAARREHVLGVDLTCSPVGDRTAKRNLTGVFQHWDASDPDGNPGGIWRPVRVERSGPVRIRHLRVLCQEATAEQAVVGVRAVLDAAAGGAVTVRTTVAGIDLEEVHTLAAGENQITGSVTGPEPRLWWPHALGDQPLHDVEVEVHTQGPVGDDRTDDDDPADRGPARLSDLRTRRIGLRAVALRGWIASVNGERLFLNGSNLCPTRMALAEASPDEVRADVDLAVEAGLDLLRVHAHIARPELYAAAEEAGLLLWQDMPLQWGYSRSVRKQAVRQAREAVDLLGHHPSLAIWCGHNEPRALDVEPGSEDPMSSAPRFIAGQQLPTWNKTVLDRSIKRSLQRHDGTRPVIAHSGVLPHPPLLDGTDSHLFFGWYHGDERRLPGFARLMPRMVRFVSELGAQAVPETDDFMEAERWPDLDWERLGHTHGLQRHVFERHVPPGDHATYDSWKQATQRYQALVIRRQIEELRRLKYRPTGGFAQLFLADAHPSVSWSVLDHERVPKAGWTALKAACRPVIVVADRLPASVAPGDPLALDVHVVSDLREPITGVAAEVRATWAGGHHTWRFTGDVDADACGRVGTLQMVTPDAPGPLELDLRLADAHGTSLADNADRTLIVRPG